MSWSDHKEMKLLTENFRKFVKGEALNPDFRPGSGVVRGGIGTAAVKDPYGAVTHRTIEGPRRAFFIDLSGDRSNNVMLDRMGNARAADSFVKALYGLILGKDAADDRSGKEIIAQDLGPEGVVKVYEKAMQFAGPEAPDSLEPALQKFSSTAAAGGIDTRDAGIQKAIKKVAVQMEAGEETPQQRADRQARQEQGLTQTQWEA